MASRHVSRMGETHQSAYMMHSAGYQVVQMSCILQVIKFKNITYTTKVMIAEKQFPTVGSTFLDLLPRFKKRRRKKFYILNNCSGYLMPGTFTLLCGPPGCGKGSIDPSFLVFNAHLEIDPA